MVTGIGILLSLRLVTLSFCYLTVWFVLLSHT
ncbi:hypothetical protein CPS_2835 [Colwellia psychrerythraea 34H]|uniref:Uncharacterized protein n=1 Tax=Colwellia psychrerythraea (strain 34H / ATCC BAA-681) TaxID=167879 RepID=Q480H9_COLP3|nr:hypothetical protein CPS_2835 [Colwellia psychrerythraea 34H]